MLRDVGGRALLVARHAASAAGSRSTSVANTAPLADVAAHGITEAELAGAKADLSPAPFRCSSRATPASMLVTMPLDELGADHLETRNGHIEALIAEDVQCVARRLLDPDNLLVVVTGQPEGIEPTVAGTDQGRSPFRWIRSERGLLRRSPA